MKISQPIMAVGCSAIWLLFLGSFLVLRPLSPFEMILALSSLILVTHVLYAGYFLNTLMPHQDRASVSLYALIGMLILIVPFTIFDYRLLAIAFTILFMAAILLHQHALELNHNAHLSYLARYKIKLEVNIIAFIAVETLLFWLLNSHQSWVGLLGLFVLLAGDYYVIVHHQIYYQ